jgi:hypothetical protein
MSTSMHVRLISERTKNRRSERMTNNPEALRQLTTSDRVTHPHSVNEYIGDNAPIDRVVRIALVASAALPYPERSMEDRILEGSGYRSERNSR